MTLVANEVQKPQAIDPSGQPYNKAERVAVDRSLLIHPQHYPAEHVNPFIWVSGHGSSITNIEGKTYIDGLSGMWNVHLGHGRKELADAAAQQLSQLAFSTAYAGATHLKAIQLAEQLREIVYPSIKAFYFTCSGSEATDSSVRTARYYWGTLGHPEKSKIIALELSYHGSTIGASSATGVPEFSEVFGPRQPGFLHIPAPYPYRFKTDRTDVTPGVAAADLLEEAILREGPETVAAFIVEPVQGGGGGGGILVPQNDYFRRVREICDRYDVLLISDDVITGFGRTGRWFGLEHWGVQPDIVQFAKGITSADVPLGGIGVSERIKSVLDAAPSNRRWWHGYTNSAHPVACAVALENIRILRDEHLIERAAEQGERLLGLLRSALADHPHVGEVRGLSLLAGIELITDRSSKTRIPGDLGLDRRLRAELLQRGLYTRVLTDVICLAPPLTTSERDLDRIANAVIDSIRVTFAQPFDPAKKF
jgi:adenosylmethionine-8-amino-7-oxononanoate aminotransferase